jgi:hypothetical protein
MCGPSLETDHSPSEELEPIESSRFMSELKSLCGNSFDVPSGAKARLIMNHVRRG